MRADDQRNNRFTLEIESLTQVTFDLDGVNRTSVLRREALNLVGSQSRIERVFLKNLPCPAGGFLLLGIQSIEACPESFNRSIAVFHRRWGGGVSCKAVSISTKWPACASFIASLNSSGIHESSCSTTNLVTCARSAGGKALNPSMISCAFICV